MSETLLSPSWYRVAQLEPRIRAHVRFHRHRHRGRTWYVLQDQSTGRSHRMTESAYWLAALMDGRRTTQEIWEAGCRRFGDDAPTQDETIRLLGTLDAAHALQCDVSPNTEAFLRKQQRSESKEWWQRFSNPLSVRVPIWDPDFFLTEHVRWARPVFTRPAALLGAVLILLGALLAGAHASDIAVASSQQLQDPRSWLLIACVYPFIKALHELGHAFATKCFGGEVHECGILFLVMIPLPYVDASSSAAFPRRSRRAAVAAAGVAVELTIAAFALFVWLAIEPGLVRSVALAVMIVGGVSTLLFNGNPLLRYDGYYVLADLLDIPNLYTRSKQYAGYLTKAHVLGLTNVRRPLTEQGEEKWLVGYAILAGFYRLFIVFAVALFVADQFFVLGVALAIAALIAQVGVPIAQQVGFLVSSPQLGRHRTRAIVRASAGGAALLAVFFLLPLPLSTRAQGVVWPGEYTQVRAGADGFVTRLLVERGARVAPGDPLIEVSDPLHRAERKIIEAQIRELHALLMTERYEDRSKAELTLQKISAAEASLRRTLERAEDGILRSAASGRFVLAGGVDLTGRFVEQGQVLAYVIGSAQDTVRVVVEQDDVALVRERTGAVHIRASSRPGVVQAATIRAEVPAAVDELPTRSLGSMGGGPFVVDPEDREGLRVLEPIFQLDVGLPPEAVDLAIGERVYVRFDHGLEPIGWRTVRAVRRLLLRRLDV